MFKQVFIKRIVCILVVSLTLTTLVTPVVAAWYWLTVDPGNASVPASAPNVLWNLYMGKASGCPETDMKWAVIFGDGSSFQSSAWYRACRPVWHFHDYPPYGYSWNPTWYVGQSNTPTYYMFSTSVTTY